MDWTGHHWLVELDGSKTEMGHSVQSGVSSQLPIMMTFRKLAHALVWTKRHLCRQLEVDTISSLEQFIIDTDICLDVGAHGGSWTAPLSALVKRGHVYAFEALPYYADVLTITLKLLMRWNITVINMAVADRVTVMPVVWKDAAGNKLTGMTHMAGNDEYSGETMFVPAISLDAFCEGIPAQRIRFVKCDVEGAELLVLKGAVRMIQTWRPLFYCELCREYCQRYGYSPDDVFAFFENQGYRPYMISSSVGWSPVASFDSRQGDVLFVPAETVVVAR